MSETPGIAPEAKLSKKEITRRNFLKNTALVLTMAGFTALAARVGGEGFFTVMENKTVEWNVGQDQFEVRDGLVIRKANQCGIDQRMGASEDSLENQPFLTDEAGFVPLARPEEVISTEKYPKPAFAEKYMSETEAAAVADGEIQFVIGDSYLQVMPPYYVVDSNAGWADMYGVAGVGPVDYLKAAQQRFENNEQNKALLEYLNQHPDKNITIDLCFTPHNDLEALKDDEQIKIDRLAFPVSEAAATPSVEMPGFSRRDILKLVGRLVGVNTVERENIVRSMVGSAISSNDADFNPLVHDVRVQRMLSLIDQFRDVLKPFENEQRKIEVNLIANPSLYDDPDRELTYSWNELFDQYAKGQFRRSDSPQDGIVFKNIDARGLVQKYVETTGTEYNELFYQQDQHQSNLGRAIASTAMEWAKKGRDVTADTVEEFKTSLQTRLNKHSQIMGELIPLAH